MHTLTDDCMIRYYIQSKKEYPCIHVHDGYAYELNTAGLTFIIEINNPSMYSYQIRGHYVKNLLRERSSPHCRGG